MTRAQELQQQLATNAQRLIEQSRNTPPEVQRALAAMLREMADQIDGGVGA